MAARQCCGKRIGRCGARRLGRAGERVVDATECDRIERADPHAAFACRPFGKQVQSAIQRRNEAVDPGDDAVQHRLDAADQPVCRLEGEVADGGGEPSPDRLHRVERAL